ncbi:MAG: ribonuclease D [Gammaproteobacteria bacterium]
MPDTIQYIDTAEQLEVLCKQLADTPWVAVDTEFLREKTYYPQFCLMQLATPDWVACVDPLALPCLEKLFDALFRPDLLKIFHSARQDLEIFYLLTGKLPTPLFDTQLAAPLLGFQENPGYGMLVSSFLNINLTKAHTRTDWSQRPLSAEQLRYAADDVIYLGQIYQIMARQLSELGRSDWLNEDFAQLARAESYQTLPKDAWLKIRGKNKLTGRQLSVLQALAEWREHTAQQENRPRNWLLRDDLLIDVAKLQPENIDALCSVRGMNERIAKRYGTALCQLIGKARQQAPVKLNDHEKLPKLTQQQEAVLDILTAIVRLRAEENAMNPVSLATRKDLEMLLAGFPNSSLLHGWRYSMVGRELAEILQGRQALKIDGSTVVFLRMAEE